MNRIELQQWLNQFDEDTIIECVVHSNGSGYYDQGGNATVEEFQPDIQRYTNSIWCANDHFEYVDLRNNQFVKEDNRLYGKKLLRIGAFNK